MEVAGKVRLLCAAVIGLMLLGLVLQNGETRAAEGTRLSKPVHVPIQATPLRRLTRFEYANSLRDLFGIDFPFIAELPADGQVAGFDNDADALALTPVLLESYLKVARKASDLVIGTGSLLPVTETFPVPGTQTEWVEGLPMGARGGVRIEHYFPHSGHYELQAFLDYVREGGTRLSKSFVLSPIEGVRFFREKIFVTAGPHTIYVTFPDNNAAAEGSVPNLDSAVGGRALGGPLDILGSAITSTIQFWLDGKKIETFEIRGPESVYDLAVNAQPGPPILEAVAITGPENAATAVDTPARRQLMVCAPRRLADEKACATQTLSRVARRAYRREIAAEDVQPILDAYVRKRETASFEQAIGMGITRILVSPDFLFRIEQDPPGAGSGEIYEVSGPELATRLSYFLWSSLPDESLLEDAVRGRLEGSALERQVRRMLADVRADALVDDFAEQWLDLRALDSMRADTAFYPEFDDSLAAAFRQETRLFLRTVMRENRSILNVVSSDFTFLNERLAALYGIEGVKGPAFRRVVLADSGRRGGVLSQGSVLMLTSHPAQTSPILRGKWVLTHLMNSPPPIPPPGVPALDGAAAADGRRLTTREQIERHRSSPVCASCHSKMDPYGIALDNYDVLGRWRTEENGIALNTSTALPRGEPFEGPAGLKAVLLQHPEKFASATVTRLLTYALGRKPEKSDEAVVQEIVQSVQADGYRFADIVLQIVHSAPFRTRRARATEETQP
jgi:hypothetical protein